MAKPKEAPRPEFWTPVAEVRGPRERLAVSRAPGAAGPVVALVHGLEGSGESWRPLVETFTGCRAYALDLPWRAGNPYRWRQHGTPADWLRRALDLVPEPVDVLLGHSFGSNAVLEHLATADSSHVPSAAVLLAPFYRPESLTVDWPLHDAALAGFRRVIADGVRVGLGERARTMDPEVLSAMVATALERIGPVGFLSLFLQFVGTTDLPLADVSVPTLVLAGERDESLAGNRATALAAAMPAATVRRRAHYGHFCHAEQSSDVAAEIAAFLMNTLERKTP
ncbi:alpha/beta fold hydrolase [Streptomyces scopuliridis]|uniref:alpha/beta fold hydrolase n=1 Tax=Streptomyces scopuliridis TaxID=452529 RepID=UPI003431CF03